MLEAVFTSNSDEVLVAGLTQWDRGQVVKITCPALPSKFQVHFANRKSETAIVVQGTGTNNMATVAIPDELLRQPHELFAFLYFYDGVIGETVKTIRMPITQRAKPDDYVIDLPQEQVTEAEKIVFKAMDKYIAKEVEELVDVIPTVSAEDNGKIYQVVNGKMAVVAFANSSLKTHIETYIETHIETYINEALGGEY